MSSLTQQGALPARRILQSRVAEPQDAEGSTSLPSGTDAGAHSPSPPACPDPTTVTTEVVQLVCRDPRQCRLTQTRWTMHARIQKRLDLTWQRARCQEPRPAPHDQAHLQEIAAAGDDLHVRIPARG